MKILTTSPGKVILLLFILTVANVRTLTQFNNSSSKKLPNPHDFNVLINPEHSICGENRDLYILVYVHSAPENYKKRQAIRETWANTAILDDLRILFVMGLSKSTKTNSLLKLENSIYGDILQEDFVDTYRNLTYKGVAGLKWISNHCDRRAKYILKSDDDVLVNIFLLRNHLKRIDMKQAKSKSPPLQKTIMCYVYKRMRVIRKKSSKWYVSRKEFKDDRFKTYCSGAAFLFTADLVRPMYEASLNVDFFWIDDYYVTGLLAHKVKAKFKPFNSLYVFSPKFVKRTFVYKKPDFIVFGHFSHLADTINQMFYIWDFIKAKFYSQPS